MTAQRDAAGRMRFVASALMLSLGPSCVRAAPPRPDLSAVKSLAECRLQQLAAPQSDGMSPTALPAYAVRPTDADSLADYEASAPRGESIGEQRADDPWLRLLLLGRSRPVLVDAAVFIDGKPFRAARRDWIDGLLAKPQEGSAARVTSAVMQAIESAKAAAAPDALADPASPGREDTAEAADEPPGVAAQVRSAPSIEKRLAQYLAAAGAEVSREEIEWLVEQWGAGPPLLMLAPARSWEHSRDAPLWACLDRDADGSISAGEIESAAARLLQADRDGDQVVTLAELRALANRPAPAPAAMGLPMLTAINEKADSQAIDEMLRRLYGDAAALTSLLSKQADIVLRFDLSSGDPAAGGVCLLRMSAGPAIGASRPIASGSAIAVSLGAEQLAFSAAGFARGDAASGAGAQIAIGAVVAGQPLLGELDADGDRRLTDRERRGLGKMLAALDANGDGSIASSELPMRISIGVTPGPNVHRLLSASAGGSPPDAGPTKQNQNEPPAWFASMDRNGDGDLSRDEFLGGTEQFRQSDADGDGLLSTIEAIKYDQAAK